MTIDTNTAVNFVHQNATTGTAVGITAHASDANVGDKITYSLTDNANGQFAIDATKGIVTVASALDGAAHNIVIKATDAGGLSTTQTIAIQSGNTIHVSNAAELSSALTQATGGETILLKAGVDFGSLNIPYGANPAHPYSSTVTIKSEDVNNEATFHGISLTGVSNLTVDSVHINIPKDGTISAGFSVNKSNNITLSHSDVNGNLTLGVTGQHTIIGASIGGSTSVTLDGNEFHHLYVGTGVSNTSNFIVKNNFYHNNLGDNSDYASNISNILIENNTYFAPDKTNPFNIHLDSIQFWVEKDATQDTSHVVIRGNFIVDLTDTHSQSIFMRGDYNQPDANGVLSNIYRLKDVTIENNVIASSQSHGISVSGADGAIIQNNTLVYNGTNPNPDTVYIPGIDGRNNSNVIAKNNIEPDGYGRNTSTPTGLTYQDNTLYAFGNDAVLNKLLLNPNGDVLDKQNFATIQMNADGSYNGALLVAPDANHPTAVIEQNYNLVDGHYTYTFDATHSLAQIGSNLNGATYQWQFADGTTAQGATVTKTFTHGGEQDVIVT